MKIIKTISLLLIISLLLEHVSFASEEIRPLAINVFQKPRVSLKFPDSVARVEDTFFFEQGAEGTASRSSRLAASCLPAGMAPLARTRKFLARHPDYRWFSYHQPKSASQREEYFIYFHHPAGLPRDQSKKIRKPSSQSKNHSESPDFCPPPMRKAWRGLLKSELIPIIFPPFLQLLVFLKKN